MKKAVFLDRDGVINENKTPVNRPEDLKIYPWTFEAIEMLNNAGYLVFVVTNQGGIEMGHFTHEDLKDIHEKMQSELSLKKAILHGIEYCPHFKTKCQCRKPEAGMILKLAKNHHVDLTSSYMVGDRDMDIEAGVKAGCHTIKIGTPYQKADYTVANLLEAAKLITSGELQ